MNIDIKQLRNALKKLKPDTTLYDYMEMSAKEQKKVMEYVCKLSDVLYKQARTLDEFYEKLVIIEHKKI